MFETNQSYQDRVEKHLVGELSPLVEAAKQGDLAQAANVAAAKAEQRRTEAEVQRRLAEADRDRARSETERLSRERQDRLRKLPVSVTLERILGTERRRDGQEWIIETDALKYSVASDDRRFCEFKAGRQAGSGAISAVISAVECSYKDAVRWLAAHFAAGEIEPCVRAGYDRAAQQLVAAASAHPITLTEQLAKFAPDVAVYWADVRQYLIQNRCLPPAWIDQLHQSGDVWANQHRSACFSLRNATGELTGAVVRGTRYKFKQTIGSKTTSCFFFSLSTHAGQRIAITESPIEAISLAAIEQDRTTVYTSTAGRGGLQPILLFAKERGGQVVAAQNDDPAGHQEASATLAACADLGLRSQRIVPPLPDWNDSLRFMTNELNRVLRTDPTLWTNSGPFGRPPSILVSYKKPPCWPTAWPVTP